MKVRLITTFLFTAALSACGGGGGGSSSGSTPNSVDPALQGVYAGTLTGGTSNAFQMIFLEDGSFWTLYGNQTPSLFYVSGFIQGSSSSGGGKFQSQNAKDFGFPTAVSGTVNATYVAGTSISGTASNSNGSVSFTGAPPVSSTYNYNTAASVAYVQGAWNGVTLLSGESANINISNTGVIAGVSSGGCQFTGNIQPRPSGKNVFNVTLTLGASPCVSPGQSASGVAVSYPLVADPTTQQLIVLATDSARTRGTGAIGTRSTLPN